MKQAQYRLRQLEEQFAAYRKTTDARLDAAPPATASAAPVSSAAVASGATMPSEAAPRPATPSPASPVVAGIEKPSTGDAAEDEYTYGYRLWTAKNYAAAATQLKKVVADYPKSRRATFAQNLLGCTDLDDGKPSLASIAFYDNYKKYPAGRARAREPLLPRQRAGEARQGGGRLEGLWRADRRLWRQAVARHEGQCGAGPAPLRSASEVVVDGIIPAQAGGRR
ncbi:tetratricopeptide repeat protein [Sphingomonas sp. MMS24-JH45]